MTQVSDTAPGRPVATSEPEVTPLSKLAVGRLRANVRSGWDPYYKIKFSYIRPSPGRYESMWFWDACFHTIALSRLDTSLARVELGTLIRTQREDGFIGHIIYWGRWGAVSAAMYSQSRLRDLWRRHTTMIQPPMLAQAVEAVYTADPTAAFLAETLPKVQAYYDWIERERVLGDTGIVWSISPWESGLDNSPAYDRFLGMKSPGRMQYLFRLRMLDVRNLFWGFSARTAWRKGRGGFLMADPLINAVYGDGLWTLARLWRSAGNAKAASDVESRAARHQEAVAEHLWDAKRGLWSHLGRIGRDLVRGDVVTVASIFPLIVPGTPTEKVREVVRHHLTNPAEFWTPFPVPSVSAAEPSFDPEGERLIWRGPMCLNLNWFIVRGLRQHGFMEEARHLANRSLEAVRMSGFREFYSPITGRGMRGTDFGWATVAAAIDP